MRMTLGMMAGALIICIFGLIVIIWLQATGNRGLVTPPVPSLPRGEPRTNPEPTANLAPSAVTVKAENSNQKPAGTSSSNPGYTSVAPDQSGESPGVATSRLQLLVPAYFYPAGPGLRAWERLIDAASKIKMVLIANPSNGPGEHNPDYCPFSKPQGQGNPRHWLCQYRLREDYQLPQIKLEIDRWVEFYPQITASFSINNQLRPGMFPFTLRYAIMPARKSNRLS